MNDININLMENLKRYRKLKGLSQDDIAFKTGISKRMISYYENKAIRPPIEKLKLLSDVLGISISKLLSETDNKNNYEEIDFDIIKKLRKVKKLSRKDQSAIWEYIDFMLDKNKERLDRY